MDARVADHLRRRRDGYKHPVEDFLFTYYRLRPGALRRWHPGLDVALDAAATQPRAKWRWYQSVSDGPLVVDEVSLARDRGPAARQVHAILAGTTSRAAHFGCFGLHEWAMVYRLPDGAQRHEDYPLRLGPADTDAVVEAHQITCTHFDAFRFFTPDARPRNRLQPTRARMAELEQPGCLHATMDLYKHAYTLGPAVPGDLLLACFDLARDVRTLDMQASPYDLRELGYPPVPIESSAGKAEYAQRQRELSERAAPLRARLLPIAGRLGRTSELD